METSIASKATEGETRAMRGLRLHRERGSEIVTYLDGTYGVPSRSVEGLIYHVDPDHEDPRERCECPDAKHGGHACMHQVFVEAHLAAKRRKAADETRPRRSRSPLPPMSERARMARTFLRRMGA